jgi:GTP-binding protein
VEPHLGELYGYIIADIPGLIEGASEGKGLGHKFLKHVQRTKMLLHCISLEEEKPVQTYTMIRKELQKFDIELLNKEEWIILTKADLVSPKAMDKIMKQFLKKNPHVHVVSAESGQGIKELQNALTKHLSSFVSK